MLLLIACHMAEPQAEPYIIPDGATVGLHAPDHALHVWPDDAHTVDEPGTATGLRVTLRPSAHDDLALQVPEDFDLLDALTDLDGFGTNASAFLRFSAPIDPASLARAVHFFSLEDGTPVRWEASWTDGGATVILSPLSPLAERSRYALLIDDELRDLAGAEVWASPWTHAMASGDAPTEQDARLLPGWLGAVHEAGLDPDQVVEGTVFTTQSLFAQDEAVAALLADSPAVLTPGPCVDDGPDRRCDATLDIADVAGEDWLLGADEIPAVQRRLTLPVVLWLPVEVPGPWPVILYGHGLGGDRYEGGRWAHDVAAQGFAVAAIDAPRHGDHPSTTSASDLFWVLEFFGIQLVGAGFEARHLRDNFRISAWDRLQLAAVMRQAPDVDGDGVADLTGTVWYAGHSLGGVVGPQLLALDPAIGGAVLAVPGGRVSEIVHRSSTFAPLISLMKPPGTDDGTVDRFFPVLQTAIERGDPATWASRVANGQRDVLVEQVLDDDIIPNETTRYLARAMGIPHVGPILQRVEGLTTFDGAPPIDGNLRGRTVGLWQYDVAHEGGVEVDATHSGIFSADEQAVQLRSFFGALAAAGRAVIADPWPPPTAPAR